MFVLCMCLELCVAFLPLPSFAAHAASKQRPPPFPLKKQAWVKTPRKQGGLGGCAFPLLADLTKGVARDYEVLIEDGADAGVALR